jgi:hypothetical protein
MPWPTGHSVALLGIGVGIPEPTVGKFTTFRDAVVDTHPLPDIDAFRAKSNLHRYWSRVGPLWQTG